MLVKLENGKRYKATVRASFGSAIAAQLLLKRLELGGFSQIEIDVRRGLVEVSGLYTGRTMSIELNYDFQDMKQVG